MIKRIKTLISNLFKKKSDKQLVFMMTPEVAMEFWERVRDTKAESEYDRRRILLQLAKEGKMMNVSETSRTKQEYLNDLSKEFRVLDVSNKPKEK